MSFCLSCGAEMDPSSLQTVHACRICLIFSQDTNKQAEGFFASDTGRYEIRAQNSPSNIERCPEEIKTANLSSTNINFGRNKTPSKSLKGQSFSVLPSKSTTRELEIFSAQRLHSPCFLMSPKWQQQQIVDEDLSIAHSPPVDHSADTFAPTSSKSSAH